MEERFKGASEFIRNATYLSVSNEDKLLLYANYKQATVGDCNENKPGIFDLTGKAKWEAWKAASGKTKEEAMQAYIDIVTRLEPDWESKK